MPTYVTDRVVQPWRIMNATTPSKQTFVGERINANTAIGAFTLLLPTPSLLSQNDQIIIRDPRTDNLTAGFFGWATNNLTISAAQPINGYVDTLICNVQGVTLTFSYWSTTVGWRLHAF